jgi:deazaflavin-dependent oxidoreductase (nitroreductase family)
MPIPMAIARFNRTVTNRVTGVFAGRLPPFVVLEHRGRKTGTIYQTPLMLFHQRPYLLIVLTYGERTDWLRNIQAANEAVVIERDQRFTVTDPVVESGPEAMRQLPRPVRFFVGLLGIDQVVRLTPHPAT